MGSANRWEYASTSPQGAYLAVVSQMSLYHGKSFRISLELKRIQKRGIHSHFLMTKFFGSNFYFRRTVLRKEYRELKRTIRGIV